MKFDILIINCEILSLENNDPITRGLSYIGVAGSVLTAIGSMESLDKGWLAEKIIDANGSLVAPGLINCHNHCAMTLFRGLADDLPLTDWLHKHIFPAEDRFVSPEMVYWCTRLAAAEMIMSGTTCVADGYFFEDDAARALADSGIRGVAAQGVIDFPAPGVPDPKDNIDAAMDFIKRWQGHELITPAVFCHSPYTCSAQTIKKAKELTRETGTKLFIHVSETESEVARSKKQFSVSPVRFLADLEVIDADTASVHCVWLDDEDIRIIKEADGAVVTCTESNMKLGSGIAPVPKFQREGIRVALGTDGSASNNDLDMLSEMDMTAKLHKAASGDPTILSALEVIRMATRTGADVLGFDDIGVLAVGKKADLIIIDTNRPHLTPCYDPASLVVYSASGADVRTSIINGKVVMEDRAFSYMDLQEILDKVTEMSRSVKTDI